MLPTTEFSNLRRFTRIAECVMAVARPCKSITLKMLRISRGGDSRCLNLSRPPCSVERWRRIAW